MPSNLRVSVLGSSGSYASPDNPCTGFLLRSDRATVLLDCGPGTLGPLQKLIDPSELTAIVLSHCHPDHWMELPVLRNVLMFFCPVEEIAVYGTAETRRMDDSVHVRHPTHGDPIRWTVIGADSTLSIGDQSWSFSLTDHSVETLACRVDVGDSSFAFSSDTGPGWSVGELGSGIDLAICEASFLSPMEGQGIPHSSARQTGESARRAAVKKLVLTHLPPGSDPSQHVAEAEEAFGAEVELAEPGVTFEI